MTDQYPIRYVAFLDILGFRNLISLLDSDPSQITMVRELLTKIHRPAESLYEIFEGSDLKVATISDAVALSAEASAAGLAHIFGATEMLAQRLLRRGYFIRGAIVKDRLFHNEEMVLGAGLVRAYSLESNIAVFPRVLLPKDVAKDVESYLNDNRLSNFFTPTVKRAMDGPRFLHILRYFETIKTLDGEPREKMLKRMKEIRDLIEKRLDEAMDNPTHYQKVHWFAGYWNDTLYGVDGLTPIKAPGLEIALGVG